MQKLTAAERLEEIYRRHNRMYDKAQADHKRLRAIAKVRIARNEKEHSEGIDGQGIEKQQDVQQTRSGSHTSLHDSENC
jgi:hypothetical protein